MHTEREGGGGRKLDRQTDGQRPKPRYTVDRRQYIQSYDGHIFMSMLRYLFILSNATEYWK